MLKKDRKLLAAKTIFLSTEGQPKRATFFKSLPDNHLQEQESKGYDNKNQKVGSWNLQMWKKMKAQGICTKTLEFNDASQLLKIS